MFLPTFARSGSWPVFTGQRSVPGVSASSAGGSTALGAARGAAPPGTSPAAALICVATSGLTVGSVLTSVIGRPSADGVGGRGPGGTGGAGGGVGGTGRGGVSVGSISASLHRLTGSRKQFLVGEKRPHREVVSSLLLTSTWVREGSTLARGHQNVLARSGQDSDHMRWESLTAANHVRDPDLLIGVGRERAVGDGRIRIKDVDVLDQCQVRGVDPGRSTDQANQTSGRVQLR
jgi:hypothetical protein